MQVKIFIALLALIAFASAVQKTRFESGYHVGPGSYDEEFSLNLIQTKQDPSDLGEKRTQEFRVDFSEPFDTVP